MNEYDIKCPYCRSYNIEQEEGEPCIDDMCDNLTEDNYQDATIHRCNECDKIFKIKAFLEVIREVDFSVEEIPQEEDYIIDHPFQLFFWENLDLGGVAIYKG